MSIAVENQVSRRYLPRLTVLGWIGVSIVLLWAVVAVFAPWLAPHRPGRIVDMNGVFGPISGTFPFGTDYMGRDMLSRVIDGARYTVGVSIAATMLASFAGTTLGLFAAVAGGWADNILSRIMDSIISLPSTIFALVIIAGLGSTVPVLIGVAAFLYTPGIYRVARAASVNVVVMDFIEVARARGEGMGYLMLREVLPNMMPPVLTDFGVRFIYIMLLISGLGFLGLGVQPPNADWGTLVYENLAGLGLGAPAVFLPAICIVSLALAVNLIVDSFSDLSKAGSSEL
ncbi:ABC transporter permease [Aquamicrobium sp. LC103]|uniref:ABC transporter permease n=1 Tax=Aquamicrobium sp. LC103 TaxID=1120658 RepID=UPI00063E848B|nr:ABC transporter permease [Aquamicrobium sp. LC103]TKT74584.1 ABC transporter permease [Aquamicrobium sp. LC103]